MASIRVTLDERVIPVAPLTVLPAIADFCRELFPSDTQITCNNTRVQASFELGEDVSASAIIDVDPKYGEPGVTRLSGSFNVSGTALRESDRATVEALAAQLFDGVNAVADAVIRRQRPFPEREVG